MPVNPNVNAEFSHRLSQEQKTSVEQAVSQGRPVDAKATALGNLLRDYSRREDALEDLASGRAAMESEWNTLEGYRTAGGGKLGADQQTRYDELQRQIKGNEELAKSATGAYESAHTEQIIGYQTQPLEELYADLTSLTAREAEAESAFRATPRGTQAKRDAEARRNTARAARLEAENIYNQRNKPNQEAAAKQAARERTTQKDQEAQRLAEQRRELEGMDIAGIRNEFSRLDVEEASLQQRLTDRTAAGASTEELEEIRKDIGNTAQRRQEADRILGDKLTGATANIDEDISKKGDESFASRADYRQLNEEINVRTGTVNDIRDRLATLRHDLEDPALTPDARRDMQNQLYDAVKQLGREEAVLKTFQDEMSQSNQEYRKMNAQQRSQELPKIAEGLEMNLYNRQNLQARLANGENLTKEEMAAWLKLTSGELIQNGIHNIDRGELHRITSQRPELRLALADAFLNSDQGRDLFRKQFPNDWERVYDFARSHPGWLMLILGALAAGGIAVAGVAGPVVGSGAAIAGGAGGGFGVSRRNWG